tara:strand:- start:417 stop:842 length:426 start_codon:yes stop_codon:yes gene_type:complete
MKRKLNIKEVYLLEIILQIDGIDDNVLIMGDVKVGENTKIGPNCILDGTGKLFIGSNCSIAAGTNIYTHHTVERAISFGKNEIEYSETRIGDDVYIGPNCVLQKGITIGNRVVIGAMSFVNKDIDSNQMYAGVPAVFIKKI